jgi:hypothetical protein
MGLLVDVVAGTSPATINELLIDLGAYDENQLSQVLSFKSEASLYSESHSRRHLRCVHYSLRSPKIRHDRKLRMPNKSSGLTAIALAS